MNTTTTVAPRARLIAEAEVQREQLQDDGTIPNNPELPLLIYRGCLSLPSGESGAVAMEPERGATMKPSARGVDDPAGAIEELLKSNHWGGTWRDGIYDYHHYHSTAHEVLVVYAGSAEVQLGGEQGIREVLQPGDAVIIPAGVGHKRLRASDDFAVVGAYPRGQNWDLCRGEPGERPDADRSIAKVKLPERDPIYGQSGPLLKQWKRKGG